MLKVNVYNNAIWDVGQGPSGSTNSGIYLSARDSTDADFNVVGNTISKVTHDGVKVNDEQDAPSHFSLDLFNNIIAGTTESAVDLTADEPATLVVRGGRNDFTSNGRPNHTLGHSLGINLSASPKFVGPATGNLALKSISPVIDKGVTCSRGGIAGPDALGKNRRFGSSVDIGAYEFDAGKAGLVLPGTSGPNSLIGGPGNDILCGYGGGDKLYGKDGNDFLDASMAQDHLYGGPGSDRVHGGRGGDRLYGGPSNDLLCAKDGVGGDHLNGGGGTDSYRADPGDVKVSVERLGNCKI